MTIIPPPPVFDPDKLAAGLYAGALLVSSIGTLVTVIVGAVRGGRKLEKIETATNGNASAMVKEIKRLELALVESMEARLAAAVASRLEAEGVAADTEKRERARDLQEQDDARGRTTR